MGEEKRADLIEKLQPWRWLELEAGRILKELTVRAVEIALEDTGKRKKDLKKEKARIARLRRKINPGPG